MTGKYKKENKGNDLMEKIVSLCKRRGFVFPGSEIYGGLAGTYDWGHLGLALKNNIKQSWWKKFVDSRRDMYGIDAAILMSSKVWEASGHVAGFSDPIVECKKCHYRFRPNVITITESSSDTRVYRHGNIAISVPPYHTGTFKDISSTNDGVDPNAECPNCKTSGKLTEARQFNMMFKTNIGAGEEADISYLRPETAQGIFVNFKNTIDAFHPKLPFGMAQIGKAFRNEIAPRDFLFRQREFEQMEIEYFVKQENWKKYFEYWKDEMLTWTEEIGIDMSKVHELEISETDRAHYSSRTVDFEFDYPFGRKELFGLAYRTDFDLKNHKLDYTDEEKSEKIIPHVIEPTFGVDRAVLALLLSVYAEDSKGGEVRSYLKFKSNIAPVICAVSPLLKNKPKLVEYANTKVYAPLKIEFGRVAWDDNGNIGKRYRRQDEIGTPFCIVVDFDTLTDNTVTVRDRDTGEQERVKVEELKNYIKEKI